MQLRFPLSQVQYWASRYSYPRILRANFGSEIREQSYLTKAQLKELCYWKSPRSAPKSEVNDEEFVVETTRTSFAAKSEKLRIEVLTLLDGVGWPVASCLLHFGISETYPIIDFRALWSLSVDIEPHQYDDKLWQTYVYHCRDLARQAQVSVRELDKALWQYSKEKQEDEG